MPKVDEQGRLRVFVEGVNVSIGNQLQTLNNSISVSTSSNQLDFSQTFFLTTSNGNYIYINGNFGSPQTISTSNFSGTSSLMARSDHIHFHGNLSGSFLHSLVTTTSHGFMDSGSYIKLLNLSPTGSSLTIYNSGSSLTNNASSINFIGFNTTTSSANNVVISAITASLSGTVGYIFETYQTASQPIAAAPSFTNIKFHNTRITSPLYTLSSSNDSIKINSPGTYKIEYRVSIDNSTNNRSESMCLITVNGAQISGSFSYGLNFGSGHGISTNIGYTYLQLSTNDIIKIIGQKISGGGSLISVPNGTNILITRWV